MLRQQQRKQQQQQLALQQMYSHRRLALTAKNPCLRIALQQQQQQQQPQPKQTQEIGLFAEHQTQVMEREVVTDGRLPVGPQGTIEAGELVSLGSPDILIASLTLLSSRGVLPQPVRRCNNRDNSKPARAKSVDACCCG